MPALWIIICGAGAVLGFFVFVFQLMRCADSKSPEQDRTQQDYLEEWRRSHHRFF